VRGHPVGRTGNERAAPASSSSSSRAQQELGDPSCSQPRPGAGPPISQGRSSKRISQLPGFSSPRTGAAGGSRGPGRAHPPSKLARRSRRRRTASSSWREGDAAADAAGPGPSPPMRDPSLALLVMAAGAGPAGGSPTRARPNPLVDPGASYDDAGLRRRPSTRRGVGQPGGVTPRGPRCASDSFRAARSASVNAVETAPRFRSRTDAGALSRGPLPALVAPFPFPFVAGRLAGSLLRVRPRGLHAPGDRVETRTEVRTEEENPCSSRHSRAASRSPRSPGARP